jgi:glycosyltransferase involved in cell wall biosynthesis
MNVLIVEPFFGGSHASWANELKKRSSHHIEILSLPGRHWKWRMHGGAVTLARKFMETSGNFDLILATDMLDLPVFLALTRDRTAAVPVAVYFHENQLSYPWSPQDRDVQKGRDFHYGFINWTSVLAADAAWFNSTYNLESFYRGVERMLKAMPDSRGMDAIATARDKSRVLPLGINLKDLHCDAAAKADGPPVFIWNHRWEYDKDPDLFFEVMQSLQSKGAAFKLIVCGESYERYPSVFDRVESLFRDELLHFGYAENRRAYRALLAKATVIPVTNKQEFFGQSVMEAVAAGCYPVLPDALAYPEHVPAALRRSVLYSTKEDLCEKLEGICNDSIDRSGLATTMQDRVMAYDWDRMIDSYDMLMNDLASSGH